MSEPTHVQITLNPNSVIAPALRAVEQSLALVSLTLQSVGTADLTRNPTYEESFFSFTFDNKVATPEDRRARYTNWVLAKGFQDLARGIRVMLEEAVVYVRLARIPNGTSTTWGSLQEVIRHQRKLAEDATFPALLEDLRQGLNRPLSFENEFLSLQRVRNCLEHRDGIVGDRDVDDGSGVLRLALPHLAIYAKSEDSGKLTKLVEGSVVGAGNTVVLRHEIRTWEFRLGQRVSFLPGEFQHIAFGCWAFAHDLRSKLPPVGVTSETGGATDLDDLQVRPTKAKREHKKAGKTAKPKPRLPRGLRDIEASELRQQQAMLAKIREVYERYGFEPLETPAFEYTDALGKFLPDQDRPNEGVFSLQDDDEQWMSLRYDLTAPLARYVAQHYQFLPKPFRRYAVGSVYRNEKPGPGRFRQFTQFDADTVDTGSVAADAEMCMLAADTMEALGIKRGDYVIKVWNRKLLDGTMDAANVPAEKRLTVLRALDKLDRLGIKGVQELLDKGRKDESGDFTKGAELPLEANNFIASVTSAIDADYAAMTKDGVFVYQFKASDRPLSPATVDRLKKYRSQVALFVADKTPPDALTAGLDELSELEAIVRSAGYEEDRIRVDPTVVRGLEYYTGPVFEAELTFEVKDERGNPVRFGSVGGGGRYDDLVARFTGQKVPATGFSIGVSRLQAALAALNNEAAFGTRGPVIVTVMEKERVADYQKMVQALRSAGIRAELYLGNSNKFAKQVEYADKRNSPCVVIQGSDEKAAGEVTLKDLVEGAKAAEAIKDHEAWKEQRPAQVTVPEADLVAEVRKILARHAG